MAEYVAEGDGWDISLPLMDDNHPIIRAALNGDTAEVRRQMSLGVSGECSTIVDDDECRFCRVGAFQWEPSVPGRCKHAAVSVRAGLSGLAVC